MSLAPYGMYGTERGVRSDAVAGWQKHTVKQVLGEGGASGMGTY